jgi:DinB superfamily
MAASPDPITASREYQQHLLALLGPDDPVDVQQATPDAVRAMIREAGDDLRRRPAAGEWSVLELVGHLGDAELVVGGRYRWALGHDRPAVLGYDQDRWVASLRHNEADPDDLMGIFRPLRAANLQLWSRSSPAERAREVLHAERGPESFDMMFRMLAGHDRFHLQQMQQTLRQVRRA